MSPCPEPLSPSSKNNESETEFFGGLYVTMQTINLKTNSKLCITNYCRTKNPFYRKVQQRLKEIYRVKQQPKEKPQKSNKQDIENKHLQTDQSLHPTGRMQ